MPLTAFFLKAGRANPGQNLARGVVGHKGRSGKAGIAAPHFRGQQGFKRLLQIAVKSQALLQGLRIGAHHLAGQVRGNHRHGTANGRNRFALGGLCLFAVQNTGLYGPVQHPVPRHTGSLWRPVRPAGFRRLRQGNEQSSLCRRQTARLLAEPDEACRPHAFQIAAEGCAQKIEP